MRVIALVLVTMSLTACSSGSTGPSPGSANGREHQAAPTITSSPPSRADGGDHHGSLTANERSEATAIAKRQQRKVTGTFVGATAFVTRGTPFDRGSTCDGEERFLNIRLVWKADANFTHSHFPNSPPDGPRKELLMTVDPTTRQVCETGAKYRNVGAAASETLLYGEWPNKEDG
jgi:hypothetical protein